MEKQHGKQRTPSLAIAAGADKSGVAMDRPIEQRRWTTRRIAGLLAGLAAVALIALWLSTSGGGRALQVDSGRIALSTVTRGTFED